MCEDCIHYSAVGKDERDDVCTNDKLYERMIQKQSVSSLVRRKNDSTARSDVPKGGNSWREKCIDERQNIDVFYDRCGPNGSWFEPS